MILSRNLILDLILPLPQTVELLQTYKELLLVLVSFQFVSIFLVTQVIYKYMVIMDTNIIMKNVREYRMKSIVPIQFSSIQLLSHV